MIKSQQLNSLTKFHPILTPRPSTGLSTDSPIPFSYPYIYWMSPKVNSSQFFLLTFNLDCFFIFSDYAKSSQMEEVEDCKWPGWFWQLLQSQIAKTCLHIVMTGRIYSISKFVKSSQGELGTQVVLQLWTMVLVFRGKEMFDFSFSNDFSYWYQK